MPRVSLRSLLQPVQFYRRVALRLRSVDAAVRYSHFEQLKPLCPICRQSTLPVDSPLRLVSVLSEQNGIVIEGILNCSNPNCQYEYPIIDGIPLIFAGLRDYVANNILPISRRLDLHPTTESLLGDCLGPNSTLDAIRYQLSCYTWDHYGCHDPQNVGRIQPPGTTKSLLEAGLALCGELPAGHRLEVGCSVGGIAFELAAKTDDLVLGIDVNFAMLRVAQQVLRTGRVSYPLRRVGLVYDQRDFALRLERAQNVDFWACDACALPFAPSAFSAVTAFNVLDCVSSPLQFLYAMEACISPGGKLILTTPYDWSGAATPYECWIGGHSQRGAGNGSGAPLLSRLLTPGAHPQSTRELQLLAEMDDLLWTVRLHERSSMNYHVQMIISGKRFDLDQ